MYTQDDAIDLLRQYLPSGSEALLVLEHVSQSGMARDIKVYANHGTGPYHLSHLVEAAGLGKRRKNRDGVRVGGCGMDMGFHLVYNLSTVLYGDGYAIKHRWL